jgi:hypothetical protein
MVMMRLNFVFLYFLLAAFCFIILGGHEVEEPNKPGE